jgi:hypothetical protein
MNKETVWSYIRVKFIPGTDPKGKRTKYSRPTRIYKIEYLEENVIVKTEYAPTGVKGTIRRINSSTFITEWEHAGKTPTPRPLRKYNDEYLKKLGYSVEEIRKIRGKNFSSKDVKIICNRIKDKETNKRMSREKAKELLIANNGNLHLVYKFKGLTPKKK